MLYTQLIDDGGPIMWVILAGSLIAVFVFLKKVFQFHREEINVRELLRGLFNVLKRDGFVEAITLCDNTPGPAARLLGAAILAYERGDEDIRQAIDDAALEEMPKLERHINLLGTIGFVMPLIGFLGTVLGMMRAFQVAANAEALSAERISEAVNMALITTASALVVAIPCYIAYNYLVARVNSITLDMEKASLEIMNFFERREAEKTGNRQTALPDPVEAAFRLAGADRADRRDVSDAAFSVSVGVVRAGFRGQGGAAEGAGFQRGQPGTLHCDGGAAGFRRTAAPFLFQ